MTGREEIQNIRWFSWTGVLGPEVNGIWEKYTDTNDINATDAYYKEEAIVTGDDFGLVKLFRFPSLKKGESVRWRGVIIIIIPTFIIAFIFVHPELRLKLERRLKFYSPFVEFYSPFVRFYSPFVKIYSPFVKIHSPFVEFYLLFVTFRRQIQEVCRPFCPCDKRAFYGR